MEQTDIKKPKIEAIYPLTAMQQGLLFHHLMAEDDQGFLHVQCKLSGNLNIDLFKKSWDATVKRHPVLRTSVHWKKIEKPIQVIRPDIPAKWNIYDWSNTSFEAQEKSLKEFKANKKERTVDFEKGPLSKLNIIKYNDNEYILIWNCHHLLLDGWSSSIILKDIFSYYEGFSKGEETFLNAIPSYKAYIQYIQSTDNTKTSNFWKKTFKNTSEAPLFNTQKKVLKKESNYRYTIISEELTNNLNALARNYRVTPNSLFLGIWSLLLNVYFQNEKIVFGNTVSGRNISFPNIDLMTGMFMNVLPVYTHFKKEQSLTSFFQKVQQQQQGARNYEHVSNDDILSWLDWPLGNPLYDSLFIFENYPWDNIESAGVKVNEFQSGITSTYPVTFTVSVGTQLEFHLMTNPEVVSKETASWLTENLILLLENLVKIKNGTQGQLLSEIPNFTKEKTTHQDDSKGSSKKVKDEYVVSRNTTELDLTGIWEIVFGHKNIGIHDSFFDLGGKSMLAVQMFRLIEKEMKLKLPPTTLLENPTISSIASVINEGKEIPSWKYLIPIKSRGAKKPLFCIHGGGGHVFFFNPLAYALNKNTPVYALQPSGINTNNGLHNSIEEMARAYADEMRMVQKEGPYTVLVYCFSTAVGIEIARYLDTFNEKTHMIIVDSMPEQENLRDLSVMKLRIQSFLKRFINNPFSAIKLMILNQSFRYLVPKWKQIFASHKEKDLEKVQANLIKVYNDYSWVKKYNAKSYLLLTNKHKIINEKYTERWEKLSNGDFVSFPVEGKHHELFDGKYAIKMAKVIDDILLKKSK